MGSVLRAQGVNLNTGLLNLHPQGMTTMLGLNMYTMQSHLSKDRQYASEFIFLLLLLVTIVITIVMYSISNHNLSEYSCGCQP